MASGRRTLAATRSPHWVRRDARQPVAALVFVHDPARRSSIRPRAWPVSSASSAPVITQGAELAAPPGRAARVGLARSRSTQIDIVLALVAGAGRRHCHSSVASAHRASGAGTADRGRRNDVPWRSARYRTGSSRLARRNSCMRLRGATWRWAARSPCSAGGLLTAGERGGPRATDRQGAGACRHH